MAELSFCNLCDQSIPDADFNSNIAIRVSGRSLCGNCQALLDEQKETPKGSVLPLIAALLGILGICGALLLLSRLNTLETSQTNQLATIRGELLLAQTKMQKQVEDLSAQLVEEKSLLDHQLESLSSGQSAITAETESLATDLRSREDALTTLLREQNDILGRLSRIDASLSVAEERLISQRLTQENLRDQLARLDGNLQMLQKAAPDVEEDVFSGEVSALVRKLQSDDPELRYDALEKLSGIQDPRLLPHIFPLLADPYEFTRFLAAHTLGDWEAKTSMPHLIEALKDEVKFVREAAVRSIRRMSGQSFDYKHDGSPEEIQAGYEQWKTWWEANKEEFLSNP